MYLTMPDGQLCIYVAAGAHLLWTKREALQIIGGVLSAIMFGGRSHRGATQELRPQPE